MSKEEPFFPSPSQDEQTTGAVPDALFDLAINRATAMLRGLSPKDPTQALSVWHARTRFARRIALPTIADVLKTKPAEGEWYWKGGPQGGWQQGQAPFP